MNLIESKTSGSENIHAELRQTLKAASDFKRVPDEHAIVTIADADGKISHANDKFCETSEYSESALFGQDHRILNSGYHRKELYNELWATTKLGSVWHGEIRSRRKDGCIYWVDTTIVPFLDDQKRPHQYIAIRVEITERKAHEERLMEASQSHRISRKIAFSQSPFQAARQLYHANTFYLPIVNR